MNNDTLGGLLSNPDDHLDTTSDTNPAPDLDMLRRMFREAASSTDEQRRHAEEDRDYFDGPGQIDKATRAKLLRRGTLPTYFNKIKPSVSKILGLLDSNESTPEAMGRNADDEDAATVVTQVLRYQADKTRLASVLQEVQQDYIVEGIGAVKVEVDSKDNCAVSHVPYSQFFYDPCSLKNDFSDAAYLIHAYWSDLDNVKRKWPAVAEDVYCAGFEGDGPEDQPASAKWWIDPTRRRVMIVDCFYTDADTGQWKRAIYCHSAVLEHGDTGYLNDEGEHICPIVAVSYHVMREGERIGLVRDLVSIQRKINALESALHRLAISNRVKMSPTGEGLSTERDLARAEAQKVDGALPAGWDIVNDPRMGAIAQELAMLKQQLDDMIPANAALAQGGANTSGRARQMLQQSGMADLSRAFGRFEDFELRTYRQMWFRARQFLDSRTIINITDNAGARQSLVINDPVMAQQMQPVMVPHSDPATGAPVTDPNTGQPVMRPLTHPLTGQVQHAPQAVHVGTNNRLATMDMDITLKVVPLADTLRGEAKQQLMEWSAKSGISPLNPAFKLLIEISDIPDKQEILRIYAQCVAEDQQMQAPQQAAAQQAQQAQQQVAQAAAAAHAQREQAAAQRDETVSLKHQAETQSIALDNAAKEALLRAGHNPRDAGY